MIEEHFDRFYLWAPYWPGNRIKETTTGSKNYRGMVTCKKNAECWLVWLFWIEVRGRSSDELWRRLSCSNHSSISWGSDVEKEEDKEATLERVPVSMSRLMRSYVFVLELISVLNLGTTIWLPVIDNYLREFNFIQYFLLQIHKMKKWIYMWYIFY